MDEFQKAREGGWALVDVLIAQHINTLTEDTHKRAIRAWANDIDRNGFPLGAYLDLRRWQLSPGDTRPIGWNSVADMMRTKWLQIGGDASAVVSDNTLYRIADGTRSAPSLQTLQYIGLTLGVDPQMLYVMAGYALPAPELESNPMVAAQISRLFRDGKTLPEVLLLLSHVGDMLEAGKEKQLVALVSMAASLKG